MAVEKSEVEMIVAHLDGQFTNYCEAMALFKDRGEESLRKYYRELAIATASVMLAWAEKYDNVSLNEEVAKVARKLQKESQDDEQK